MFMEFFKTQSDQNIHQKSKTHQTALHFQNFLRGAAYAPELPSI